MTLVKTNHQMDIETAKRFAGMDGFLRLPKWSYDGIGVDADTQCPEVVYPEMARDSASAQRILQEIVGFLKPYGGANKALHTTAAAPGF
jgi:hypothetical protein